MKTKDKIEELERKIEWLESRIDHLESLGLFHGNKPTPPMKDPSVPPWYRKDQIWCNLLPSKV